MPAIVFNYKIHQLAVAYTNYNENFFQFLINLCAILGGVFTVIMSRTGMRPRVGATIL